MNDRLQQLALFVRTVESGNFSKAAREFGLSQPSVSRSIAALERRLGVKLLIRTTRQVSATDAGDALLGRARDALLAIDEAESAARGADRLAGVLRVALPPEYGVRRIVPLLPAFFARHPLLKVDLMMSDRYENLIAEGADVALRIGDLPDSSFVARKLESARRLFIAAPSYLARRGAPASLADLAGHDVIGGPADVGDETWIGRRNGRIERQLVSFRARRPGSSPAPSRDLASRPRRSGCARKRSPQAKRSRSSPTTRSIRSRLTSSFPQGTDRRNGRAPSATIWSTRFRRFTRCGTRRRNR
jgi:DNA-binding transcriptional LysR family regulator